MEAWRSGPCAACTRPLTRCSAAADPGRDRLRRPIAGGRSASGRPARRIPSRGGALHRRSTRRWMRPTGTIPLRATRTRAHRKKTRQSAAHRSHRCRVGGTATTMGAGCRSVHGLSRHGPCMQHPCAHGASARASKHSMRRQTRVLTRWTRKSGQASHASRCGGRGRCSARREGLLLPPRHGPRKPHLHDRHDHTACGGTRTRARRRLRPRHAPPAPCAAGSGTRASSAISVA